MRSRLSRVQAARRWSRNSIPELCLAQHFVHMGHGVDGPDILWVRGQGRHAGGPGRLVVAALFQPEGRHAQDITPALALIVRQGAGHPVTQVLRLAQKEVQLVTDQQGQGVGRRLSQAGVENPAGRMPVSGDPLANRSGVGMVLGGPGLNPFHGPGAAQSVALLTGHQAQIGAQGPWHEGLRIPGHG